MTRARKPRRARAALRALTVLGLLWLGAPTPLRAQQAVDRELTESQRRLEQIRRERAQLRQEMDRIRGRVHDISGELRILERQVETSASVLGEIDYQLAQHRVQIEQNTRELLVAQDLLAERRAILHRRLRDVYKRGPLHEVEVLLSAKSFSDLLSRYKYLFLVTRRDRALVQEVASLEDQLTARERGLRRNLAELQSVLQQKTVELAELESLEREQQRALSGARQRERTTARRIEQLARDERRLANLIGTLERRRREAERAAAAARARSSSGSTARAPAAGGSTLTTRDLGRLGWPVEGRLVYRFGRTTQPNGTVLRWNGVGIGAAAGTPVRAVEEGTVVLAGPFEGYGPTVVLSHGGGYYSLYLYLREVSVREGAQVTRSQVVGTVGGEQTPEGAHIEFQIREPGGQAVDPLTWLQKGRSR